MAAMSKFMDFGSNRLAGKIEDAIKKNLERIGELKQHIGRTESENDELAKQND